MGEAAVLIRPTTRRLPDGSMLVESPTRESIHGAIAAVGREAGLDIEAARRLADRHARTTFPGIALFGSGAFEGISYMYVIESDGSEAWRFFPRPGRETIAPVLAAAIRAGAA